MDVHIGKIVGTHGLKGEVVLKHALGKKTTLKGVETLFVEEKGGNLLPWFIESAKAKNESEIFIKLQGVETKEAAQLLTQKKVHLSQKDFEQQASKQAAISLLGFTIIDAGKTLGKIEEIIEQPQQILCRLNINDKEVYIPLHEETLKGIDHKKKTVSVVLPEGLLEIYLGDS